MVAARVTRAMRANPNLPRPRVTSICRHSLRLAFAAGSNPSLTLLHTNSFHLSIPPKRGGIIASDLSLWERSITACDSEWWF